MTRLQVIEECEDFIDALAKQERLLGHSDCAAFGFRLREELHHYTHVGCMPTMLDEELTA